MNEDKVLLENFILQCERQLQQMGDRLGELEEALRQLTLELESLRSEP